MNHKMKDVMPEVYINDSLSEIELKMQKIKKLKEKFLQFKKVLQLEKEELSDREFFENYAKLYKIDIYGLKKAYAEKNLKNPKLITLKTEKVFESSETKGQGRSFGWYEWDSRYNWYDWYVFQCEVYARGDFQPSDKRYTIKELQKLIDEKKLVIKNFVRDEQISEHKYVALTRKNKKTKLFDICDYFVNLDLSKEDFERIQNNFPECFKIVRESFTDKQLQKDFDLFKSEEVKAKVMLSNYVNRIKEQNDEVTEKISKTIKELEL